jgi:PKD repeat protein
MIQRLVLCVVVAALTCVSVGSRVEHAFATADGPQVNFQADPRRGDVPLTVHFTNTSNDAGGTPVSFLWSFGDGASSPQENPAHSYASPGKFDVTLSVTDDHGRSDVKTAKGFITVDPPGLLTAVLPVSRSVQLGTPATVFASVINVGGITAAGVGIELNPVSPGVLLPATLTFQPTDAANNPIGALDGKVDIPAGKTQSFVITITPTAPFLPTEVSFDVAGSNTSHAHTISGLNTLLLSASTTPVPDVIAIAATLDNDGIVAIPGTAGTGVFSVATMNLGAGDTIAVSADTGSASVPVALAICQTVPATGECLASPAGSVTASIDTNATPTFGVFVTALGVVPYDPAVNRVFVRFTDAGGAVRGATSVAVKTR